VPADGLTMAAVAGETQWSGQDPGEIFEFVEKLGEG
jgi:hypothetical protein